ncbi:16410_t:CDS:2 [Entrophospora sp. SA101]|nr:19132_t:CDS:2 [Entrophospora sp. SA101]CAJ0751018.1 7365_t:CDS:2 [Entrophospora sp. SA101]CAJ0754900.1 16410_t:CDS:2 [Entrophospora sp. SA101]
MATNYGFKIIYQGRLWQTTIFLISTTTATTTTMPNGFFEKVQQGESHSYAKECIGECRNRK